MKLEKKEKNAFGADWLNANINSIIPGKSTFAIQKQINKYITLKLMGGRTYIYVNGKRFIQCIRLILNIPKSDVHLYDEVDSIDEAANLYSKHVFQNRIVQGPMAAPVQNQMHDITPEQEFWGHCSNIQAWVEHDYDTRILMSNIAFPLLRELTKAGDPLASKVFKEEIALRLESGYPSVVQYLLNQAYLRYFTVFEFKTIIETTELIKGLSSNLKMLSRFLIECSSKFPTIIEDILLKVLRLPEGKKVILSSMNISESPKLLLMRASLRANPRYLLILKNALENLFHQVDQKTGQDIKDCIQEIKNNLGVREVDLPNLLGDLSKRYEAIKKWNLDENVLQNIQDKRDLLILKKLMNKISLTQSRCSYCGKIIPKGQEICEWCGHKRDDDEGGFFPYQRIFKPPGGGGGSTKGTIALLAKVRT
ncbi:MAG: zinc ribbon domain-containing protein [Promethearchaeota archaeon]